MGGGGGKGGGGKGKGAKQPNAPDYAAAAREMAAGNLEAARVAAKANRVNQYTPYGNITYTGGIGGDQDVWRSDISLSPTGQQLLDYSNAAQLGLGEQTGQALGRVDETLSQPFDYGSVGELSDAAYAANTARLDPQWERRESMERQRLANQGIGQGSEAYTNAMGDFEQGRTDAYSQARKDAFALMPQTFQLSSALRSQPLNELNALRTGSQVTNPTFTPVPQQQTTAGPNMLGAAQAQYAGDMQAYQAQQAANNGFMGGLFQLGGAALSNPSFWAAAPAASDRRLKSNIRRIGTHPLGIGVYEYDIFGARDRGVMADEVLAIKPEAVLRHPSGYLMVDYGRL